MDSRTPQQRLDAAIAAEEWDEAVLCSRALPELSHADLLRLTILSARQSPGQFTDLVRDWLVRALDAGLIELGDIRGVVLEMDAVREGASDGRALLERVRRGESSQQRR